MIISTVNIDSWEELHIHSQERGFVYRGQGDSEWELETSFVRLCRRNSIAPEKRSDFELSLMREFQRGLYQFENDAPASKAKLEWLALMQHHGTPTRLLDFTYSLYVAAYFALEHAEGPSAIWAINAKWALNSTIESLHAAGNTKAASLREPVSLDNEEARFNLLFKGKTAKAITPLNPFRLNERLRIQRGVFLAPGNIETSFRDNLVSLPGSNQFGNVRKFLLSPEIRKDGLEQLYYMNISRTSLFPGLDGYAQSLGVFHSIYNPMKWT